MSYGYIKEIKEITNLELGNRAPLNGEDGQQLGFSGLINSLFGRRKMAGYEVTTNKSHFLILIDNEQSCCEDWGYISSEDNLQEFVQSELLDIVLTDTALDSFSTSIIEMIKYPDEGGIQFVTFKTSKGDFQLAVYNAHNGYYGHGIIVAENNKILLDSTL